MYRPDSSTNKEQSNAQTEIRQLQKDLKHAAIFLECTLGFLVLKSPVVR